MQSQIENRLQENKIIKQKIRQNISCLRRIINKEQPKV